MHSIGPTDRAAALVLQKNLREVFEITLPECRRKQWRRGAECRRALAKKASGTITETGRAVNGGEREWVKNGQLRLERPHRDGGGQTCVVARAR